MMEDKKQLPEQNESAKQPKTFWTLRNIILVIVGVAILIVGAIGIALAANPPAQEPEEPEAETPAYTGDNENAEPAEGDPADPTEGTEEAEESETTQTSLTNNRIDAAKIKQIDSYSYTDASLADEYCSEIVATVGDHELTGGLFNVFYWAQVGYLINSYGEYLSYYGLDATKSLSEQYYSDGVTWEQYFIELTMDEYLQYCALYDEAVKHGVEPTEEMKESLTTITEDLEGFAVNAGFESAEDYLLQTFGAGVTREDYAEYYTMYYTAQAYANKIQEDIKLSEQEVEAFYLANASNYEQQGVYMINRNVVDVRHILIQPEQDEDSDGDLEPDSSSERAWAAAEEAVNDTYERWKQNPTEENFATVATDTTYDTGSAQNGGLYEGVYPGQMVAEFEEWCFDESRKPGDHEIIRTQYGYHIMYFVGEGDYMYWYARAENDCKEKNFNVLLENLFDGYELEPYYGNLHIYDRLVVNAANAAAAENAAEETVTP